MHEFPIADNGLPGYHVNNCVHCLKEYFKNCNDGLTWDLEELARLQAYLPVLEHDHFISDHYVRVLELAYTSQDQQYQEAVAHRNKAHAALDKLKQTIATAHCRVDASLKLVEEALRAMRQRDPTIIN